MGQPGDSSMNFAAYIQKNADKIDWQPIETLPWELNDADYNPPRKYMPQGIILRYTQYRHGLTNYELIGDNIAGERTVGCSCCSIEWSRNIELRDKLYKQYNAWAWAFKTTIDIKRDQVLKMKGAIEALNSLLDHCRDHTIPVDEGVVWKYLQATKKELAKV